MTAQAAFAENCQTRLVLEPWRFAQAAWFVAPTVGSPPASPAGCLSPVALHFAVFLRLTTGSALELAPMGSAFPSTQGGCLRWHCILRFFHAGRRALLRGWCRCGEGRGALWSVNDDWMRKWRRSLFGRWGRSKLWGLRPGCLLATAWAIRSGDRCFLRSFSIPFGGSDSPLEFAPHHCA